LRFAEKLGASVEDSWDLLGNELFFNREISERVYRLMDSAWHRFTVDMQRWLPEGLTGAWLAGAVEPGSLPRKGQNEEGNLVILTGCTDGR
jgi:hypothetical protein